MILYLNLSMGAAGDMLTSALMELIDDKKAFADKVNSLGIEGVEFSYDKASKCGIYGNRVRVVINGVEEESNDHHEHHHDHEHTHEHEHHHDHEHEHHHYHHAHMSDIESTIRGLNVSDNVKFTAIEVYKIIANAESKAHDKPVGEIHFHEVGMKDAIIDIVAVCMLLEMIAPDKIVASPVRTGYGQVKCAHGIVPVPAPATSYILEGIPVYAGDIEGELLTPTGAALIKAFVDEYSELPESRIIRQGYGVGHKDFKAANVLRAMLVETKDSSDKDNIIMLECNIDDMSGEDMGYAIGKLMDGGARDVFVIPVIMKKSRQGMLLKVITDEAMKDDIVKLIFKHTTTIGIREIVCNRYILERRIEERDGVRFKVSEGYGVRRVKIEHDDLERIADEKAISISEVRDNINI